MDLFSHKHVLNYLPPSNTDALGRCGRFPEHFCIFLRSGMRSTADSFVNNPSPLRDFFKWGEVRMIRLSVPLKSLSALLPGSRKPT